MKIYRRIASPKTPALRTVPTAIGRPPCDWDPRRRPLQSRWDAAQRRGAGGRDFRARFDFPSQSTPLTGRESRRLTCLPVGTGFHFRRSRAYEAGR